MNSSGEGTVYFISRYPRPTTEDPTIKDLIASPGMTTAMLQDPQRQEKPIEMRETGRLLPTANWTAVLT